MGREGRPETSYQESDGRRYKFPGEENSRIHQLNCGCSATHAREEDHASRLEAGKHIHWQCWRFEGGWSWSQQTTKLANVRSFLESWNTTLYESWSTIRQGIRLEKWCMEFRLYSIWTLYVTKSVSPRRQRESLPLRSFPAYNKGTVPSCKWI